MKIGLIEKTSLVLIAFLLLLIFSTTGLQDWWPSLLKNWQGQLLYKDIHFYTGPLYPVLLKLAGLCVPIIFAPKVIGSIVSILYVFSALIFLKSYLIKASWLTHQPIKEGYLFVLTAFFLVVCRYLTVYLIPDDYHTLSLLIFCLIGSKIIVGNTVIETKSFLDSVAKVFYGIPMPLLISALILNRFHEGIIFLFLYIPYKFASIFINKKSFSAAIISVTKELLFTIVILLGFFVIFSPTLHIANIFETFKYLIFDAPSSKGFGSNGYFLKLLINFGQELLNIIKNLLNLAIILVLVILFFIKIQNYLKINSTYKKLLQSFLILLFISLGAALNSHYFPSSIYSTIIKSTIVILSIQFILITYVVIFRRELLRKLDFGFIPLLALFFAHLLSTSGIVNEPLILLYFPSVILNLYVINPQIFKRNNLHFLALLSLVILISFVILFKIKSPRNWWLVNEIPIYANREFMFGDKFNDNFPNLKSSLSFADVNFLTKSDELCYVLNKHNNHDRILSYPVPYFSFACKGSDSLVSYTSDFTFWYDVARLDNLVKLQNDLNSNISNPEFVVMVSNPLSLIESAKYYSPNDFVNYRHYIFINFLSNFVDKKYDVVERFYLINGRVATENTAIQKLDFFYNNGCFQPNKFEECSFNIASSFGTKDLTFIGLYKLRKSL